MYCIIIFQAPDPKHLVMLHSHGVVLTEDQKLLVIGGGGNCFSFGTHFNAGPVVIDLPSLPVTPEEDR